MCIICLEWEKGRLTSEEAFRAIGEAIVNKREEPHLRELSERILSKEIPETETNDQIDQDWWNHVHDDE